MSNIVEHIKQSTSDEITTPLTINVSTIAGLALTNALEDSSRFELSVLVSPDRYESRAVSWKTIMAKLQTTSFSNFNAQYRVVRHGDVGLASTDDTQTTVYKYLTETSEDEYRWVGTGAWALPDKYNTKEPCVWGDVWTLTNGEAVLSHWLQDLDERLFALEHTQIAFSSDMTFSTKLSVFQGDYGNVVTPPDVNHSSLSEIYNNSASGFHSKGFVVAFWKHDKTSSEFVCPSTGMLTLYGWLDSSNVQNLKYLPSAWCALEGKINGKWEILQLQSVTPAKQFSYVSFCVPVMANLTIRLELGFIPGEASDRYDRSKIPESLANTQPNAFMGGIYMPTVPVVPAGT